MSQAEGEDDLVHSKSMLRKERKAKNRKQSKWTDRWPAVVTREGKGFLWLTVGVAFAALNTGNNLLYLVLSFMLSLLLLSMLLAESGIRSLEVQRLRTGAAFADEPVVIWYRVTGRRRWLPVFAVEVRELNRGLSVLRPAWIAKVGGHAEEAGGQVRFIKRGPLQLRDFQVRTSFPFGLVEKRRWFRQEQELVVYPSPGEQDLRELAKLDALGEQRANQGPRTELGELREYIPGDPIRAVHWLRSAAVGELIARDHVAQRRPELVVDIAHGLPARSDESWRAAIEERIRAATRVVLEAAKDASAVSIHYGEQSTRLVAGGSQGGPLRFLAFLELDGDAS